MQHDVIVIGSGLFGQIVAKAMRVQGRSVLMIDALFDLAGSLPAACLMKPSWFSSMGKEIYEPSLKLLDDLYGVQDIVFETRPKLAKATVHWIPPAKILGEVPRLAEVIGIEGNRVLTKDDQFEAPLIVVAAGIWTEKLLPQYKQVGQQGVAFLWPGKELTQPFIQPWAPYRQLVAFERGDGIWASDGTAIKMENWTREREEISQERVERALPPQRVEPQLLLGIRPYSKAHKPCLLEEVRPGLWVASGGAKNGTLAAGYCAHMIRERTS